MHAPNPSQEESLGFRVLDVLESEDSEEFQVDRLETLILQSNDTFENRSVVFRVRVELFLFDIIKILLVHVFLNVHDLFEDDVDISLDMGDGIEYKVLFLYSG